MLSILKDLKSLNINIWSVGLKGNTILKKNRISKLDLNEHLEKGNRPVKIVFDFDV